MSLRQVGEPEQVEHRVDAAVDGCCIAVLHAGARKRPVQFLAHGRLK